ncbi:HlyD family secretion protein [Chitinophaga sp. Cy-1792]|uniref:HlyD family secretion protein n=1 Tax=Chitinophaga sp. Cy-1792 TaxID=2608339 RepID=UPI00141EDCF5|nr:HlyD family secretion protein [Chitinophaga sp. Cy-1792]NIG55004.1 hypothetical protein [Chitinophaga sp. Cy-1792]
MSETATQKINGSTHASLEEVRSEAVQEIMGKMPSWIIRSGMFLIGLLVLVAMAGAWFFHYPEVTNGKVVITRNNDGIAVIASVPAAGAWKLKPGQPVLIRLTAYPYEEFGMLQGRVDAVSATDADGTFSVAVNLEHAMHTTAGREVPFQPRLEGQAEITTGDSNLLQRLFGNSWKLIR